MDFKEFATNYLNPIFLFYRFILLSTSFFILFFSLPVFANSAGKTDLIIALTISVVATVSLYLAFKRRALLLYMGIPFILVAGALTVRGDGVLEEGILIIPVAMWWTSSLLIAFNGFRSWGYGMSINDINEKLR